MGWLGGLDQKYHAGVSERYEFASGRLSRRSGVGPRRRLRLAAAGFVVCSVTLGGCSAEAPSRQRSITDPDPRVTAPPPTGRAELLVQLDEVRRQLVPAPATDVAAQERADACLRLDALEKLVLTKGRDAFGLSLEDAGHIRGADLQCVDDAEGARQRLSLLDRD